MLNMKKILFAFMAMMGVLVFTGCSNEDLLGVDNHRKYEANFVQTFGKVNPAQDFNTLRAVTMDVSVANTQGNYTLRVFSAMPNTKGAKLLGKFENLNAGQVSTVRVDAHKAAKNIYCMVDDGVNNITKTVAIPSAGKASVKFDGIANARNASTRADGDEVVDILVDGNPNTATIAFEDLGASDDFDFNDAVIKAEYVTGTGKLKVTLMAVGAVLPLKLYCAYPQFVDDEPTLRAIDDMFELIPLFDGQELHAVMGESQNTMINTNWKGDGMTKGKDNVPFVSCEIDAPYYLSLSDDGFPFLLEVDGKKEGEYRITNNGSGAIPQVMVIGDYYFEEEDDPQPLVATRALGDNDELYAYMWRWSKERVSILDAYPNINTWIEDDPYDFSFMIDGVVENNLYDGYNPSAAYDDEGDIELQAVDLGLPSGTLWANMNVGATAPELAGGYYAWGETAKKDWYDNNTYLYGDDSETPFYTLGDIRGTQYDVAHTELGGDWVMPTAEQFEELFNECDFEYVTRKGIPGYKLIGPNGNSIFLPLTGWYYEDYLSSFGNSSYYWTSGTGLTSYDNEPCALSFYIMGQNTSYDAPYYGQPVRAVINQSQTPAGPVAVDLGLPSGTKWANMNVGATAPEDYGDYFAWGETEVKDEYSWVNYTHSNGTYDTCTDIGVDIAGKTEYDAATANLGTDWQMPTWEQFTELVEKTTNTWTTQNGVNGWLYTEKNNGNSIFLPAAGNREDTFYDVGTWGYYWTSMLSQEVQNTYYLALEFKFYKDGILDDNACLRNTGLPIRPVQSKLVNP